MRASACSWPLSSLPLLLLLTSSTLASSPPAPDLKDLYQPGNLIGVSCLNRTIDTGEHVADSHGTLQYIPFPPPPLVCSETSSALQLPFLSEAPFTCTIAEITDELYHLLEFYVHADSPLSCRIPRRPEDGERDLSSHGMGDGSGMGSVGAGSSGMEFIPLVISIGGKLEKSHVHIANKLNLVVHISHVPTAPLPKPALGSLLDSATAYSTSPLDPDSQVRITPGAPLPLVITPRWYLTSTPPRGTTGRLDGHRQTVAWAKPIGQKDGGHITVHTVIYCVLSCVATAVACCVYFRGWEFPKRLRRYDFDRRGGGGGVWGGGNLEGNAGTGGRVGYGYGGGIGLGLYGGAVGGGAGGWGKKD